ncbi:poly(ADP-ribose) glycohydrolase ARH3 [Actinopolyspora biskrensis]|uniref:Poly(ADP-ribose) glycohydrolase ARH3 n=1 Tax=Actinopolyspora biskrensis TaxID=1470178 RepID=A0A852Z4T4_9ACTN|nr:poly(ADP-ribose) glycohydrolase ARH3 [Actinopolyspora biskrensis]
MNAGDRRDRAAGLLLGAALGDALGARFEGMSAVRAERLDEVETSGEELRYTDDTVLTLVLAEHLVEQEPGSGIRSQDLALGFARAWRAEPGRGWGGSIGNVFRAVLAGSEWSSAARSSFGGQGSYGNGAAMRVSPVALVAPTAPEAAALGQRSGEVTHAHPDGSHAAAVQACAVHLALSTTPGTAFDADRFLDGVASCCPDSRWISLLERTRATPRSSSPGEAAERLGNDVTAPGSVPLALFAFLRHPDSPREAVRFAIAAGGDTDTIGSMAGALAGARCGATALPPGPLRRLEGAARLRELGSLLASG